MCRAPRPSPTICIYYSSIGHRSAKCDYKPWDNREQQRPIPDALRNQQNLQANTKIPGTTSGNVTSRRMGEKNHENLGTTGPRMASQGTSTKNGGRLNNENNSHSRQNWHSQNSSRPCRNVTNTKISGGQSPQSPQQNNNHQFPYRDHRYEQERGGQHRQFDEKYNQRYSLPAYPKHLH